MKPEQRETEFHQQMAQYTINTEELNVTVALAALNYDLSNVEALLDHSKDAIERAGLRTRKAKLQQTIRTLEAQKQAGMTVMTKKTHASMFGMVLALVIIWSARQKSGDDERGKSNEHDKKANMLFKNDANLAFNQHYVA